MENSHESNPDNTEQQKKPYIVPSLVTIIINSMSDVNRIRMMEEMMKLSNIVGLQLVNCSSLYNAIANEEKIILTSEMGRAIHEEDCTSLFNNYEWLIRYLMNSSITLGLNTVTKDLVIKARNILINVMKKSTRYDEEYNALLKYSDEMGQWTYRKPRRYVLLKIMEKSSHLFFIVLNDPCTEKEYCRNFIDILQKDELYQKYLSYWES